MNQLYATALEAAAASLFLIPVLLFLNHIRFRNMKSTFLYMMFAVYLCGVYAVVGLPNISYIRFEPNISVVPFAGMLSDPSGTILNVVLFVPLGLFLFLLWKPLRRVRNLMIAGLCLSLTIEFLQMFTFRATDINDLITNVCGTLTGYGLGWMAAKSHPSLLSRKPLSDLFIVLITAFSVMFLFQPLIWKILY